MAAFFVGINDGFTINMRLRKCEIMMDSPKLFQVTFFAFVPLGCIIIVVNHMAIALANIGFYQQRGYRYACTFQYGKYAYKNQEPF